MRILVYSLAFLCGFTACTKPAAVTPDTLTGVWVEETTRTDTLLFNLDQARKSVTTTRMLVRL